MANNTILIIDDDIFHVRAAKVIMTEAGYQVISAESGAQAIDMLVTDVKPSLILLDVEMPSMNGYETIKRIKKVDGCQNIPIIFLTSVGSVDSEVKGLTLGAVDYVKKPFKKQILLARIKAHISNYRDDSSGGERSNALAEASKALDSDRLETIRKQLNDTEFDVARLIAMGYSNQEIADELSFSYGYVKQICHDIFKKLSIAKRAELRQYLKN